MMKRLYSIMVLCILLCCFGCSTNDTTANDHRIEEMIQTNDETNIERPEPPLVLEFGSFERIAELKSMLEKDNDTVDNYLDNNNYRMNGLSSKDDIAKLFNDIDDLNMFHMDPSSGYSLEHISYYVSYKYIVSTYSNGNERERIQFICYIGATDEKNASNKTLVSEKDVVSTLSIGNKTISLFNVEEENSPYALIGRTQTDNSRINILLFEDNVTNLRNSIDKNIVSLTLLDLIEK
ncbi:MAG: hypothetical protein PUC30_12725 [Lachnospiraceae bacterium]|nr:hypothetical protein [Lachnospiraceae bacterium]